MRDAPRATPAETRDAIARDGGKAESGLPPQSSRRRAGLARSLVAARTVAIPTVVVALLILRRPESLTAGQFGWEEAPSFFAVARLEGPASIMEPWAGALHLLPRVVHEALVLVPATIAPALAMLALYATIGLVAGFLVSDRMATAIPDRRVRVTFALGLALLPNSAVPLGSILNVQWFTALYLAALVVASPARTASERWTDRVGATLAGLTGPSSLLLAPLFWLRRRDLAPFLTATAGVQLLLLLASTRRPPILDAPGTVTVFVERLARATIGTELGATVDGPSALALGAAITPLVLIAVVSIRRSTAVVFGYAAVAIALGGILLAGPTRIAGPSNDVRFFLALSAVLILVAASAIAARRPAGWVLAACLALGVIGDARMQPLPASDWGAAAACLESAGPCHVQVWPSFYSFEWKRPG